jgi:hypothetical protein
LLLKGIQSGDDMDAMQSCYELNDFLSLNTEESLGSTFKVTALSQTFHILLNIHIILEQRIYSLIEYTITN